MLEVDCCVFGVRCVLCYFEANFDCFPAFDNGVEASAHANVKTVRGNYPALPHPATKYEMWCLA